ncbi:MAG TPA: sugar ABC transporter substrate-binding protein [Gammaproteobacteria bacterium]|jgi:polysaccharide export outer membrane protein|nr:sugar ABC transporter substrate-binding protein [Gammaproteobacteria bacterium]
MSSLTNKLIIIAVVMVWLIAGCASKSVVSKAPVTAAASGSAVFVNQVDTEDYRIGVDDVVQVSVWKNEDLSVQVPVRPDGKISVPLIGDVRVGGETPTNVSKVITERLRQYLRDPKVTVILADLKSHEFLSRVRVTGAVATPTSISFRQGMTVLDAVLEAGGVTKFASADATRLYRQKEGGKVLQVKLKKILKKGDLSTNHALMPGDVITVPERFF